MGEESISEEKSTCCCVEGMADQLRKFEDFFAFVFEENDGGATLVIGTIRKVLEDGQILHMENVQKIFFFNNGSTSFFFNDLYISICEITEFSPQFPVTLATATQVNAIQNQVLQNTNAKRVN